MNPVYQKAHYVHSAHNLDQLPEDSGIEVAFAGRSNAGKSSAINAITRQGRLAKVSKTPGRTQLINFFALDEGRHIVDLPGYGFAKVPLAVKQHWVKTLEGYLAQRQALRALVLVMDIRHPLRDQDWQMVHWASGAKLDLHLMLTKADKLKRGAAQNQLFAVQRELEEAGVEASLQTFSATKGLGIDDLHGLLDEWFEYADRR
ncbi:MAG: ribosome biogenesis GTP-binding protein YihA/YsxC [Pseudomonadota bacterium]